MTPVPPADQERLREGYAAFLHSLTQADEVAATDLALDLFDEGCDAETLLLGLIAPAQEQIGLWWQHNEWTVAQEHAASSISERVIAAIATTARPRPAAGGGGGPIVVACVDGEWHSLPARLVAELLRLRGRVVRFLGASVPVQHLIPYAQRHGADAIALSCSVPMRLPAAHHAVRACRRAGVPVVVGGRGFGADGRWAARLGAVWAPGARQAADVLAAVPHPPGERLAHLADNEHTGLVKRRGELIEIGLADLRQRFPPAADYAADRIEATVADLGQIIDALTAAVYVDDPSLFTQFIAWTAGVLSCRGVAPQAVGLTLERYEQVLYDFPRALGMLAAGRIVAAGT